jgi:hypothetical protein
MSARNSRKAKVARRAQRYESDLPALALREQIATAVHDVISDVDSPVGACALYSLVGALVTSILTGHFYEPQCGRLVVEGEPDELGPIAFACDPKASGYSGLEFHCWFVRPLCHTAPGLHGNVPCEWVDLSLRTIPALARRNGITVTGLPDYFWGIRGVKDESDPLAAIGVYEEVDPIAYEIFDRNIEVSNSLVDELARRALDKCSILI